MIGRHRTLVPAWETEEVDSWESRSGPDSGQFKVAYRRQVRESIASLTDVGAEFDLPAVLEPEALATCCRNAGLAFLTDLERPTKRNLASWLLGPYRRVSSRPPLTATLPRTSGAFELKGDVLTELVLLVRGTVVRALASLAAGDTSWVQRLVDARYVTPLVRSRVIWLPLDEPGVRLESRVLSLFAADYLARPEQFARELNVCVDCSHVAFDGADMACPSCTVIEVPV